MTVHLPEFSSQDDLWSPWTSMDRPIYEKFCSIWGQNGSYETNFAYIQQECRDRAWKYVSDTLLVSACARGENSEFVFVLPPIGSVGHAVRMLPKLCSQLSIQYGRRVVIRKLQPELYGALLSGSGFKSVPLETYTDPREIPEDIHPQVVAGTRRKDEFIGGGFVKTRNQMKTAHRGHQISFEDLNPDNRADVIAMIETWTKEQNERLRQSASDGKAPIGALGIDPAAYNIFCECFAGLVDNVQYFGRVMVVDGQVSAFSFAGRTSQNSAGLYASICRLRSRGLADCMIADMLDTLAAKGVEQLNFGGSEGLNLFKFKNKWGTTAFIETCELEYLPNLSNNCIGGGS